MSERFTNPRPAFIVPSSALFDVCMVKAFDPKRNATTTPINSREKRAASTKAPPVEGPGFVMTDECLLKLTSRGDYHSEINRGIFRDNSARLLTVKGNRLDAGLSYAQSFDMMRKRASANLLGHVAPATIPYTRSPKIEGVGFVKGVPTAETLIARFDAAERAIKSGEGNFTAEASEVVDKSEARGSVWCGMPIASAEERAGRAHLKADEKLRSMLGVSDKNGAIVAGWKRDTYRAR